MSSTAVTVPGEYVGELRQTLISFYGSAAEGLFHLADNYLKQQEPLEVLLDHRRHLHQLDELINTIGWGDATPTEGDVELRGDRHDVELRGDRHDVELRGDRQLLATALSGVLLELGERVPEACRRCWLGETEPAEVAHAACGVLRFLPLATRLDGGPLRTERSAGNNEGEL